MKSAIAALLLGAAMIAPASGAEVPTERIEAFRDFLREFRQENAVLSFSVALAKDGEIVMTESLGWQDHDAEEPTTPQTSYLAASITKTFTAATLLAMEADGHIDLDADFTTLSDWDGRCEWLGGSGIIFGGGTLDDGRTVEPVRCEGPITLRQVLQNRVQGEPGTSFFYNPVVFGRLSNWVEENTDRSWRDWMRTYVIEPAGLNSVAAGWRDAEGAAALTHLAPPFRHAPEQSDGLAPSVLPNPELNASSGIIASAEDLAAYSVALDEGRILPPALREAMWTPPRDPDGEPAPYANGWFVQDWQGHRLVWHGGWWPDAYAGLLLKAPDDGWTLVALGNTDGIRTEIDTLTKAQIEKNPLAAKFLELFVAGE
ncbi:serine hydrolase domain-containing protein [Parvularcula oceani]|uniref:serine hydrolase domain-containing protein n=1 Tax=Parvularcula oceani TaxID=1247963 RepID=UPI0004E13F00|nr:serine hydrolase domain-containing protein [Parvularcula oceani]